MVKEGNLTFFFDDDWEVSKLDDWSYYREQFSKLAKAKVACSNCHADLKCANCKKERALGPKAIDILAISPDLRCWCIEIKDYRLQPRQKTIGLADEIAFKIRDTLSVLAAGRLRANDKDERYMADRAMQCKSLRIVLHLEQPTQHSKLFPRAIDPANVEMLLKQLVKAIDPHPCVVEAASTPNLGWKVK